MSRTTCPALRPAKTTRAIAAFAPLTAVAALAVLATTGCGDDSDGDAPDYGIRVHDVGHRTAVLDGPRDGEHLTVEIWYPTLDAPEPALLTTFVADADDRARLQSSLDNPAGSCVNDTTGASRDAGVRDGSYPLLVFSHCLGCMRFSSFRIAEHLAARGFVVVAPDHGGNTWFDVGTDAYTGLTAGALQRRVEDVRYLIDVMTGARKVGRRVEPDLYHLLENLAISRGMKKAPTRCGS